jgi:uncharacterized integral membrane protein
MNRVKIAVAGILGILLLILRVQNRRPVETHLLFATVTMAQSILLLETAALGFGAGALLTWFLLRRNRRVRAEASPAPPKSGEQA